MYNVLVVDDEKAIRDNIASVVPFESNGFTVCGTAKNGEEATKAMALLEPDLILLDVNMPVMDGLTFLECLRKGKYKKTKVIMLSGYSDFDYARKAVRLGVKAYMTKPIDEDEADILLKEIIEELEAENHSRVATYMNRQLNAFKMAYSGGALHSDKLKDCFLLHTIILERKGDSIAKEEGQKSSLNLIQKRMADVFGEDKFAMARTRGCIHSFILPLEAVKNSGNFAEIYGKKLVELVALEGIRISVFTDFDLFIHKEESLREDYANHLYAMCSDLFFEEQSYIKYKPIGAPEAVHAFVSKKPFLDQFKGHMLEMNFDKVMEDYAQVVNEIWEKKLTIEYIQEISFRIYYLVIDLMGRLDMSVEVSQLHTPEWRDRLEFTNYEQWRVMVKDQLDYITTMIQNNLEKNKNSLCYDIISYVKYNYRQNITIKDIAQKYHLNAAYVGRMFKRETGVSIKKYIANLRIEDGKVMLLNTDKLVYEIAQDLGYGESKYFIEKFRTNMGCSPSQYRKNMMDKGASYVSNFK